MTVICISVECTFMFWMLHKHGTLYRPKLLTIFCLLQEEIGFNMKILDIGGGFSGSEAQLELVSAFLSDTVKDKPYTFVAVVSTS